MNQVKIYAPIVSRYLLGLIYLLSGVAGLFNLIPPPPDMPEGLMTFMGGLMATQYFMPFLKVTEIVCGIMLIARVAPSLALVILAPITINIFLVHLFLTPGLSNLVVPIVVVVLQIVAMTQYLPTYKLLFRRT